MRAPLIAHPLFVYFIPSAFLALLCQDKTAFFAGAMLTASLDLWRHSAIRWLAWMSRSIGHWGGFSSRRLLITGTIMRARRAVILARIFDLGPPVRNLPRAREVSGRYESKSTRALLQQLLAPQSSGEFDMHQGLEQATPHSLLDDSRPRQCRLS